MNLEKQKRLKLKQAREEKGFTQSGLADAIGVSLDHVKSLEYGRVNPSISLMFKICSVLESSPEILFSDVVFA